MKFQLLNCLCLTFKKKKHKSTTESSKANNQNSRERFNRHNNDKNYQNKRAIRSDSNYIQNTKSNKSNMQTHSQKKYQYPENKSQTKISKIAKAQNIDHNKEDEIYLLDKSKQFAEKIKTNKSIKPQTTNLYKDNGNSRIENKENKCSHSTINQHKYPLSRKHQTKTCDQIHLVIDQDDSVRSDPVSPFRVHGNTDIPVPSINLSSKCLKDTERKKEFKLQLLKFTHKSTETLIDSVSSKDGNSSSDSNKVRSASFPVGRSNNTKTATEEISYQSLFDNSDKENRELDPNYDLENTFIPESVANMNHENFDRQESIRELADKISSSNESLKEPKIQDTPLEIEEQNSLIINNENFIISETKIIEEKEQQSPPSSTNDIDENDLKRYSFASTMSISSNFSMGRIQGLKNPKGYCFLNSVIQVLLSCRKFQNGIYQYHMQSKIEDTKEQDNDKIIFVINFCTLCYNLKKNFSINHLLDAIQEYFKSSSSGDDVNKCFMNLLSTINDVTKNPRLSTNDKSNAEKAFRSYRNLNKGFLFDCFYGLVSFMLTCEKCKSTISNRFQLLKSLSLPVPETNKIINLEECLKIYFEKSVFQVEETMNCECPNGTKDVSLRNKIVFGPKYLFIYLDRGSLFIDGVKKSTFVKCSDVIEIKTASKRLQYKLISVIDHMGTNVDGHYFCKCNYETENWYLLNDTECRDLGSGTERVSRNSIAFMLKKIELKHM